MLTMVTANTRPHFGELWMCQLCGDGSVQRGFRPVFVLSNDINNVHSTTINVIPLTTRLDRRYFPMHVRLDQSLRYGLRVPSTLLVEQIATVSLSALSFRIGSIDDRPTLLKIYTAIETQFPLVAMFAS